MTAWITTSSGVWHANRRCAELPRGPKARARIASPLQQLSSDPSFYNGRPCRRCVPEIDRRRTFA